MRVTLTWRLDVMTKSLSLMLGKQVTGLELCSVLCTLQFEKGDVQQGRHVYMTSEKHHNKAKQLQLIIYRLLCAAMILFNK